MQKKYTKEQVKTMIDEAIAKTIEKDIADLEKIMKEHDGKVDSKHITAMALKNMMLFAEFQHFLWEDK